MTYYVGLFGGSTARFVLRNRDGRALNEAEGPVRDDQPQTLTPSPPSGPVPYPSYEVVTIGGFTEVIEHRDKGPLFYVTDDADVKQKLGVPIR